MKRIQINCTECEAKSIRLALTGMCIFEFITMKNCHEESDCNECLDDNIEFNILESEGE